MLNKDIKDHDSYKTISEVCKEVDLIDKNTGNAQTHTIRYWETQFTQLKPVIRAGKRRYYSKKDLSIIKFIKFLLKEKGFTISGVKKILNSNKSRSIDVYENLGLYSKNFESKKIIRDKIKRISKIVSELKKYK